MTFTDIKRQLRSGSTQPFYVFCGEEIIVQSAYIHKIAESKNQSVKYIDKVSEAIKQRGLSLFDTSICYVCRDDADFQKAEKAWEDIAEKVGKNTLIYCVTKIDKRSKFYNHFADSIVMFDYMGEPTLVKHIKEHVGLSTNACKELIKICQSDYGRILLEIDKIQNYVDATKMPCDLAMENLIADGVIYTPPSDVIFEWVNSLLEGKKVHSFKLYQECLDLGEPILRLLLVLYNGCKHLLQVQSCSSKNISESTGLASWEINLVKDYVGVYSNGELVDAMRNIRNLEVQIKRGQIDEEYAVPYAMLSLLSS